MTTGQLPTVYVDAEIGAKKLILLCHYNRISHKNDAHCRFYLVSQLQFSKPIVHPVVSLSPKDNSWSQNTENRQYQKYYFLSAPLMFVSTKFQLADVNSCHHG